MHEGIGLMLWTKDFLFLHYPKAAGKSLARAFLQAWETPIWGLVSPGQVGELSDLVRDGVELRVEGSHQNATTAARILQEQGLDIGSLKAVFVAIRDPRDLIYSTYRFMRERYPKMTHKPNFVLAGTLPFDQFVARFNVADYNNYLTLHGEPLSNLRIIRFEHMAEDMHRYAEEFGFAKVELPHLNASRRGHYREAMAPEIEAIIAKKYRALYDRGLYPRLHAIDAPVSWAPDGTVS